MGRIIPFHFPLAPPGIGKAEVRSQNEEHVVRAFCSVFRALRSLPTAWVFLPDPAAAGLAIIFPRFPFTLSRVMESIKVGSTLRTHAGREKRGLFWQPRFLDRALRSVKEYSEKVEYIHLNPVRVELVKRAEDWQRSSGHDYRGGLSATFRPNRTLASDRVLLPADERGRI